MLPPSITSEENAGDPAAKETRSFWESTITITPVVLTLLSTLLAGLSSSAMIRAQYYRSLAAQYQAKAGDQWAFFQAKRTRRALLEQGADRYVGIPGEIDADRLMARLQAVSENFRTAAKEAGRLGKALTQTKDLDPVGSSLGETLRRLAEAMDEKPGGGPASADLQEKFRPDPVRTALSLLGTSRVHSGDRKDEEVDDAAVLKALEAIRDHKPESDVYSLVAPLSESQLENAVAVAEANAWAFEEAADKVDNSLRPIDDLVNRQVRLAEAFHRVAGEVDSVQKQIPPAGENSEELRQAAGALLRTDLALQGNLWDSKNYQATRRDHTIRRYAVEGSYNRAVGAPYELRVYKSSDTSDKYRIRSQRFFYGMLIAQAGAAIASLALAGRRRSALWFLASLAGFTAVGYTAFVYWSI
jgi:hypothetical protein